MIVQPNSHLGFVCRNLNESIRFYEIPDGNRVEVHQYTERSFQLIGRN